MQTYPLFGIFSRSPVLKYLLPFMGGIILRQFLPGHDLFCILILLASAFLLRQFSAGWLLLIILSGFLRLALFQGDEAQAPVTVFNPDSLRLNIVGRERDAVQDKAYTGCLANDPNVRIYLSRSGGAVLLSTGQSVLLSGIKAKSLYSNANSPYESYLRRQGFTHSARLGSRSRVLDTNPANQTGYTKISVSMGKLRLQLADRLKHRLGIRNGSLISGLLLGLKKEIPPALSDLFKNTGLSHLLAVSGLHAGFLILILYQIIRLLPLSQTGRTTLLLGCLAFYALLTGLSASIVRTSLMAGTLFLAPLFKRRYSALNILAVSALIQLMAAPDMLFEPGFQMSYSAVAGILLFYRPLRNALTVPARKIHVPQAIADVLAVSLAASLATAPITLWTFSVLPGPGLILNIVVIPLTFVLMAAGILALIPLPGIPGQAATAFCDLSSSLYLIIMENLNLFSSWTFRIPESAQVLKTILFTVLILISVAWSWQLLLKHD